MDENELTLARAEIARLEQELTIARHEHLELLGKMRKAKEILVDSTEIPDNKERHAKALKALDLLAPDKKTKSKVTEIRNIYLFIRYLGMIQVHPPYETPPPEIPPKLTKDQAADKLAAELKISRKALSQRLFRGRAEILARDEQTAEDLRRNPTINESTKQEIIDRLLDKSWLAGALPPDWPSTD